MDYSGGFPRPPRRALAARSPLALRLPPAARALKQRARGAHNARETKTCVRRGKTCARARKKVKKETMICEILAKLVKLTYHENCKKLAGFIKQSIQITNICDETLLNVLGRKGAKECISEFPLSVLFAFIYIFINIFTRLGHM